MSREQFGQEAETVAVGSEVWVWDGESWNKGIVSDASGSDIGVRTGPRSTVFLSKNKVRESQKVSDPTFQFWRTWTQEFATRERKPFWIKQQGIWMRATLCDQRLGDGSPMSVNVVSEDGETEAVVTPDELLKWSQDQSRPNEADFAGEGGAEA